MLALWGPTIGLNDGNPSSTGTRGRHGLSGADLHEWAVQHKWTLLASHEVSSAKLPLPSTLKSLVRITQSVERTPGAGGVASPNGRHARHRVTAETQRVPTRATPADAAMPLRCKFSVGLGSTKGMSAQFAEDVLRRPSCELSSVDSTSLRGNVLACMQLRRNAGRGLSRFRQHATTPIHTL